MRQAVRLDDVQPYNSTTLAVPGEDAPSMSVIENIALAIRGSGTAPDVAAQWQGVPRRVFRLWLRRRGEPYETLRRRIAAAEASLEISLGQKALNATEKRPDIALAMLRFRKRLSPERERRFARRAMRVTSGRASPWSEQRQIMIASLIERGNAFSTSCRLVGVSPGSAWKWLAEGRKESQKDEPDESRFELRFYRAVTAADSMCEMRLIGIVNDAAEVGEWKAATWLLEHGRSKAHWSKSIQVEQTIGGAITVEHKIAQHAAALPDAEAVGEVSRIDSILDMIERDGSFQVEDE